MSICFRHPTVYQDGMCVFTLFCSKPGTWDGLLSLSKYACNNRFSRTYTDAATPPDGPFQLIFSATVFCFSLTPLLDLMKPLKLILLQIYFLNSFSNAISWHTALANGAKFYVNSANYGHLCCSNRARNSSRKMTIHLNKGRSATDFDFLPDRQQLGNWLLQVFTFKGNLRLLQVDYLNI